MRLGIMQPYFFPYLGYFALIDQSDAWIVFDVTQYTPKTWMNRNRVLHPRAGWQWVTVPLSNSSRSITISEARILNRRGARDSALGKLSHYRKRAPYWRAVEDLVRNAFDASEDDSLVSLNVSSMSVVCRYLEVPFEHSICSELSLDLGGVSHPGGWAPAIASALHANEYLNPIGGGHLFRQAEFRRRGVELLLLEMPLFEYPMAHYGFEPNLSVLDVLMWNDPGRVRDALATATVSAAWGASHHD